MQAMGVCESLVFFAIPTLLLYLATHIGVTSLSRSTGLPTIVSWFINDSCASIDESII
ncbi:MAG: hypothetical protein HC936_18940 [Leptolyngbyaceae cyanobacterium SU_3_3]|nr:hypothetical protein [Leptolyngbyaceae cyanobacterium SU_3_3]